MGVGAVIFCNVVLIAAETDYTARSQVFAHPLAFTILDNIFCIVFALEIIMRLLVHGRGYFFSPDWKWNVFDLVITALQMIDMITRLFVEVESAYGTPSFVNMFRIIRLLRVGRAVRIVHLIRDLRVLSSSI